MLTLCVNTGKEAAARIPAVAALPQHRPPLSKEGLCWTNATANLSAVEVWNPAARVGVRVLLVLETAFV